MKLTILEIKEKVNQGIEAYNSKLPQPDPKDRLLFWGWKYAAKIDLEYKYLLQNAIEAYGETEDLEKI